MDIVSVIATIGGYFVEPIQKHCGYLIHYNSNIKNLEDRIQNLRDKRVGVQLKIEAEKRKGWVIAPEVETWVEKVHNILDEDVEANKMRLGGWCPRYYLSRKAKKKTLEIDGLLNSAQFAEVSYPPPLVGIGSLSSEGIMDFKSRTKMMNKVLEALRDDKVNMIAICGMGGIGKTTMAKEVAKRAKDDKLFDEVVMVVVSQNQDLRKIQGQIAEMLGLKLVEENSLVRKHRLKERLMDNKSILVILDDVWDVLDLEAVGIPYGDQHNQCKILLTSRSEEACTQMKNQMKSHMKSQKIFEIEVLSEEEAWNLLRKTAGNCIDTPNIRPTAKEVAKECGGLPVAIVTVGRALENKSVVDWIAALQQLNKSIPKNIPGLDSKVYSSIELSYTHIKSDEAKSCFLLCCLFPEDYDIPIEYLARYAVGRRLFAKINNVAEARYRAQYMVENLKRSFLLLDSKEEGCVKMHDIVRDVAISIADELDFLVGCDDKMEEWPENDKYGNYAAISLFSREMKKHPDGLECPKLKLLQLSCSRRQEQTFPANMFKGMNELTVLSMENMYFSSLPQSIQVLQNLQTLHLQYCHFEDASAIGSLGKLEILSFYGSYFTKFPMEIANLSHLKLLDLLECTWCHQIPRGLLSSLSRLEELYLGEGLSEWEPTEGNREGEGSNASLAELMSFSHHLMALKICIANPKSFPKDFHFKNHMTRFHIFTGPNYYGMRRTRAYLLENSLEFCRVDVRDIPESLMLRQLLQKSEILYLREIENLKNILFEFGQEGFPCLKVLRVHESKDVEYVIDPISNQTPRVTFPILESLELSSLCNLKEIYHSQFPERSFSDAEFACFGNLRSIELHSCECLKNVFSLSIARSLVQLQQLNIERCGMEEIFPMEGEDEKALDEIRFLQLTSIRLEWLRSLIGFCTGVGPVEHVQSSLNQEVGRIDTEEKHKMTDIQQRTSRSNFPESTPISNKLFSSMTILWPPNLEELYLRYSESFEVVFDLEGLKFNHDRQRITVLAQLKTLYIDSLSKLTYVWKNVPRGIQGFQNLTSIEIGTCRNLKNLFPLSIAKLLVQLQRINIGSSSPMENIVHRDGEEEAVDKAMDTVLFPKLTYFSLGFVPNLMSLCIEPYSFTWSSIKNIDLCVCLKLKTLGSEIQSSRKMKKIRTEKLDPRPQDSPGFLGRCLECVPRRRNYGPMVVSESDRGTTNKSLASSSMNKEGTTDNSLEISSLFPSHMIEFLRSLEVIHLQTCYSIEVIFQLGELNVEEGLATKVLDQLRELTLHYFPKLTHIWKKGPERITGFGNLRLLLVYECNNLTYLFSPSIAKLLVMLEDIKVASCEKIEEILARVGEEEEENDVLFHKVNSILLMDLPNLRCFCPETNAFEWPLLKKIIVCGCPSLSTFIPSNLNMPKLEGVYDGVYDELPFLSRGKIKQRTEIMCHWKGDLNATIQHMFKGKEKQVDYERHQQEQTETIKNDI